MRSSRLILLVLCAIVGASASAQQDLAIVQAMRHRSASVRHVTIVHRSAADPDLDIVVARAAPRKYEQSTGLWWTRDLVVGVFLQSRVKPGMLFKIAVEAGPQEDCYATVERASPTDVVIGCLPEKGRAADSHKFVYDIRAKSLVKRIVYSRLAMHRIFRNGAGVVLVGVGDLRRAVAVDIKLDGNTRCVS